MAMQIVSFKIHQEEVAFPVDKVQEIIRLPEIIKIPGAARQLVGVGNLRGIILPILSLRRMMGLEDATNDDQARIVVLRTGGTPTGVIVDSVSEVITVHDNELTEASESLSNTHQKFVKSIAQLNGGKRLLLILNHEELLPDSNWKAEVSEALQGEKEKSKMSQGSQSIQQVVTCMVGDEELAINIQNVREIIRINELTPIPKAPENVVGLVSLRNQLLPIFDLKKKFKYDPESYFLTLPEKRVVVVEIDGKMTGVLVDSVSQVLNLDENQIEITPDIIKSSQVDFLRGLAKLQGGKRIILLLSIETLLESMGDLQVSSNTTSEKQSLTATGEKADLSVEESQLVCFWIGKEEYGLDIMRVQEIIRLREITKVPQAKEYMEGILNLRGSVVPVLDLRSRLGIPRYERNDATRIIVVNHAGQTTGIVVDCVSEVVRMAKSVIEKTPQQIENNKDRFIEGIGRLKDGQRMIILLRVDTLLEDVEVIVPRRNLEQAV